MARRNLYLIRIVRSREQEVPPRRKPPRPRQSIPRFSRQFRQNPRIVAPPASPSAATSISGSLAPRAFFCSPIPQQRLPRRKTADMFGAGRPDSSNIRRNTGGPHHFPYGFSTFRTNCPNFTNSAACAKNQKKPHHFPCSYLLEWRKSDAFLPVEEFVCEIAGAAVETVEEKRTPMEFFGRVGLRR